MSTAMSRCDTRTETHPSVKKTRLSNGLMGQVSKVDRRQSLRQSVRHDSPLPQGEEEGEGLDAKRQPNNQLFSNGNRMVKTVPWPGVLSTLMEPVWSSITFFVM